MNHKKSAEILIKMLDKFELAPEEKEAVLDAIGVLSWTQLAQSRIKNKKNRK